MRLNLQQLDYVIYDQNYAQYAKNFYNDIAGHVDACYRNYWNQRQTLTAYWMNCWSQYLVTEASINFGRLDALRTIGNVKTDWRHKINTGKAFETVETASSYLMQSFMPNEGWLHCKPGLPVEGLDSLARVLQFYLRTKFKQWFFKTEFEIALKQLLITGTSVMAIPWVDDTRVGFECLDMFDFFFDANSPRVSDSPIVRRITKTRADIIQGLKKGFYSGVTEEDVVRIHNNQTNEVTYSDYAKLKTFNGLNVQAFSMSDKINMYEYWGDVELPYCRIKNVIVTVMNGNVVRMVKNNYKCGRPFVVMTYTPVVRQPYGIGILQPSLGLITQLNNNVNQMLDGTEVAINPMFEVTADSGLDPEEIVTEPGKVYKVQQHGSIRPIEPPRNNFNLSLSQLGFIESAVNSNSGTGPLIGTGQPRGGERVTATEINQVVEAGGNRLLNNYNHIFDTAFQPLLDKTLSVVKQFTKVDDYVIVPDEVTKSEFYMVFGPEELQYEYLIEVKGANFIIQRQEYLRLRLEFIERVAAIPGMIDKINLDAILEDLLLNWGFEEPLRYMRSEEPQPEMQMPGQGSQMPASLESMLNNHMQVDGGRTLIKNTFGVEMPAPEPQMEMPQ